MLSDFGLALYTDTYGFCTAQACYTPHITPETIEGPESDNKNDIYQAGLDYI